MLITNIIFRMNRTIFSVEYNELNAIIHGMPQLDSTSLSLDLE